MLSGQDVKLPAASGDCGEGYFAVESVCVSLLAVIERGTDAVAQEVLELMSPDPTRVYRRSSPTMCKTTIETDRGDVLVLENGAVVEITWGFLGYVGYRNDALLFRDGVQWKIWIEGKSNVFAVDMLRTPSFCTPPSTYYIEAAANDEVFIINGEKYEAKLYCMGWSEGDAVVFLDGSALGVCVSATLFNPSRGQVCGVWCE
jgi:hypothetical protein